MSTPTSTRAVKAAIRDAIVAIEPSFDYRQGQAWEPVEETDVGGLRRFWLYADAPAARVLEDGQRAWGIVEHWAFPLVIRTAYGDLPIDRNDVRGDLVTGDAVDLDRALRDLVGGTDGLIRIASQGPEVVREGDRWAYVHYRYTVGYYQEGT